MTERLGSYEQGEGVDIVIQSPEASIASGPYTEVQLREAAERIRMLEEFWNSAGILR